MLSDLATWLTTDPQKTVLAFVAGAVLNAGLAEWRDRSGEDRRERREAADRLRSWNLARIAATKKLVVDWTQWMAFAVRQSPNRTESFDLDPTANLALVGDDGLVLILGLLPVPMSLDVDQRTQRVLGLRRHLLGLLDQQERRVLKGEPVIEAPESPLLAAVAHVMPISDAEPVG